MTKTEKQRLALALLKARPAVVPGTRAILDKRAAKVWNNCVYEVAVTLWPTTEKEGVPGWWWDATGVAD